MPNGFSPRFTMRVFRLMVVMALLGCAGALEEQALAQFEGFFVTNENAPAFRKLPGIENQLYGHSYASQSVPRRISRIERTLFGSSQRGPLEARVLAIDKRMREKTAKRELSEQEPLIEYLEQKLFQRTYADQSLSERVRQLEVQVFGHAFDNYPLSVRIKKLSYAMPLMAKEIRLTKDAPAGDMVIASTQRVSRHLQRSGPPNVDVVELDATKLVSNSLPSGVSTTAGDYLQSVYREPNGAALRWMTLPIKVFIRPDGPNPEVSKRALDAWRQVFSVQQVNQSAQADVIVTWDQGTWSQNTGGLMVRPVVQVDDKRNIRTVILLSLYPLHAEPSNNQLRAMTHALGHAFGLWGHSDTAGDIMKPLLKQEFQDFPTKWSWRSASVNNRLHPVESVMEDALSPSQRDVNTLLKLYELPVKDLGNYSPY